MKVTITLCCVLLLASVAVYATSIEDAMDDWASHHGDEYDDEDGAMSLIESSEMMEEEARAEARAREKILPAIPLILSGLSMGKDALNMAGVDTAGFLGPLDTAIDIGGLVCFHPNTPIDMADGTTKHIRDIKIGDETRGGTVTGVMQFDASKRNLFEYNGVIVAGEHKVLENGTFVRVQDSAAALSVPVQVPVLYDLDTTNHRIYARNTVFADFSEVDPIAEVEQIELDALNNNL